MKRVRKSKREKKKAQIRTNILEKDKKMNAQLFYSQGTIDTAVRLIIRKDVSSPVKNIARETIIGWINTLKRLRDINPSSLAGKACNDQISHYTKLLNERGSIDSCLAVIIMGAGLLLAIGLFIGIASGDPKALSVLYWLRDIFN